MRVVSAPRPTQCLPQQGWNFVKNWEYKRGTTFLELLSHFMEQSSDWGWVLSSAGGCWPWVLPPFHGGGVAKPRAVPPGSSLADGKGHR